MLTANANLLFNPFVPNAPFLYPLKSSENRKVEKGSIGSRWVQIKSSIIFAKNSFISVWQDPKYASKKT